MLLLRRLCVARIGIRSALCNAWCVVIFFGGAAVLATGCKEDEAAVSETAGAGGAEKAEKVEEPIEPVAVAPIDLFKRLPSELPGLLALPGDPSARLKKDRRVKRSEYSARWLVHLPDDGPFRMVHYQLSRDQSYVEAIIVTMSKGYAVKERLEALEEAASMRLGKAKPLGKDNTFLTRGVGTNYEGKVWNLIDYRLELRTDTVTGDLELLFHRRGRSDTPAGIKP